MRAGRINWTPAQLAFVKQHSTGARRDLHAAFVKKFGAGVTLEAVTALCKRNHWNTDGENRMKGKSTAYTDAELKWLEQRKQRSRPVVHRAFMKKFGHPDLGFTAFNAIFKNRGWVSGINTRFAKGSAPGNKGKKMPEALKANPAFRRNQFKKGEAPLNIKYAGHERVSTQGYVEISINETNPHTGFERRYVQKHKWLWEKLNGPVPDGMVLKCLGKRANPDPDNWELIPIGMLPRLNNRWGRNFDVAPEELKPTIMAVAKLEHRIREKT